VTPVDVGGDIPGWAADKGFCNQPVRHADALLDMRPRLSNNCAHAHVAKSHAAPGKVTIIEQFLDTIDMHLVAFFLKYIHGPEYVPKEISDILRQNPAIAAKILFKLFQHCIHRKAFPIYDRKNSTILPRLRCLVSAATVGLHNRRY
jgi:hypothetical protein